MFWKSLVFTLLLAGVFAEQLNIPEDKKTELQNLLREQCKNAGNEDKVDDVTKAGTSFVECVKGLFDVDTLKREIEEAKPNGGLDEVFKKYCAKTPQLKTCIHTVLDEVSPCLDSKARDQINGAKNGTDQLIDFVCYKDGDRIALFIAEGGPQCFTEKVNDIKACADTLKNSVGSPEAAKALTPVQRCQKFDQLTDCIVRAVNSCDTPTPGNMAESLFRYVRKGSPCTELLPIN